MARSDPHETAAKLLPLKDALDLAGAVICRRATIPVLSCVRLLPGQIAATDLDNHLQIATDLFSPPPAGVQVERRALAAAVRDTDGSVAFDEANGKPVVRIGSNPTVRLPTCPEDFPGGREIEDALAFEIDARQLAADIACVSAAMSTEETRYYLMGMFWHVADGELFLAATDGHRLHRVRRPAPEGAQALVDSIVPARSIRLIAAALAAQPNVETVRVRAGKLAMQFEIGAVMLRARLIDGTYPDYRRVIPKTAESGMKLAARELTRPAELAKKLLGKSATCVRVCPQGGTVTASSAEGTEISARLDRELIGEAVPDIGFRHEYLIDSLTPFLPGEVTMAFADSSAPCLIEGETKPELTVVLMPMRA